MSSPHHTALAVPTAPGAALQDNENEEVCVTFVIRAQDAETIERLQNLIKMRQANGDPLVAGQTRLAEYQPFSPTPADTSLLDDLQEQRQLVSDLENRIADVERAGRVRAKEAVNLAEQRRVELRDKLEQQYQTLVEYDKKLRALTEKYDYYADIRDRCIQVRILQQIANDDEDALVNRLQELRERNRRSTLESAEVTGLIESAKDELAQTVTELRLPRAELEAERFAAQRFSCEIDQMSAIQNRHRSKIDQTDAHGQDGR